MPIVWKLVNKYFVCLRLQENILLRQKGQSSIKVIDFGSSCYEPERGKGNYTCKRKR